MKQYTGLKIDDKFCLLRRTSLLFQSHFNFILTLHKTECTCQSRNWIFQAEAPYELSGLTPNVVFHTGLLLRGDELWMYYGAADSCTCLATAKLDEVLALLVD
ncbi:hypothetical protein ACFL5F_01155 [Planctomycetota bacterium]